MAEKVKIYKVEAAISKTLHDTIMREVRKDKTTKAQIIRDLLQGRFGKKKKSKSH